MPYYDYKCDNCQEKWEDLFTIENRNNPENEECPKCSQVGGVKLMITDSAKIVSGIGEHGRLIKKAGDGWKDVLNKIKKGSSSNNTIRT